MKKILAVASGGGHWKELLLLKNSFDISGSSIVKYVTTLDGLPQEECFHNFEIINESNITNKLSLIVSCYQILKIYIKFRPDIVITTGAAPGIITVLFGKIFNSKTIWVDSIANADKLSLSGYLAKNVADIVLTQWEHLADGDKVLYKGSIF
jgi:UDP-N-acetylglucosamine:LPS N-acetylglucosamine transferase